MFPLTTALRGGAVAIVLRSLLKRGLVAEVRLTAQDNVWRTSEVGEALTLRATPLAFQVLGIEEPSAVTPAEADGGDAGDEHQSIAATIADQRTPTPESVPLTLPSTRTRRSDSKPAALIAMLQRTEGASLDEIVGATGWQAHTVRDAIAGALKKRLGRAITSERVEGRGRVYRILA